MKVKDLIKALKADKSIQDLEIKIASDEEWNNIFTEIDICMDSESRDIILSGPTRSIED